MALVGNERFYVQGIAQNGQYSGEDFPTTTGEVAALGAGGRYVNEEIISSGSTNTTAAVSTFVGWNSASGLSKTNNIPDSTGSQGFITIADMFGDAGTNNIQAVSNSPIFGNAFVYTNNGSITLYDSSIGWVSV